ncbi:MAG: hypothetical protein AB7O44_31615 [Hyphomicrobiaceae bacterium]
MIAVEAVELHHVAGAALLVGDLAQVEVGALMLLMAGRAVEAVCGHVVGREDDVLHARGSRHGRPRGDLCEFLGALLQHRSRSAVRVEGRVRHLVAGETSLAVSDPVSGDESVKPAQFAVAALGVADVAILDCGVSARQRPRHQELRVLGEKERGAHADDGH